MHPSTQSIFDGTDPPPPRLVLPPTASDRLSEWFGGRIEQAATRSQLYSVALILQHRYFFERRRSPDSERDELHTAYERCFERLEERIFDTDPPLPDLTPPPVAPLIAPEELDQDFIELKQDLLPDGS